MTDPNWRTREKWLVEEKTSISVTVSQHYTSGGKYLKNILKYLITNTSITTLKSIHRVERARFTYIDQSESFRND